MAAHLGLGLAIRIREERDGERRRGAESSNRRNPRRFLVGAAVDLLAGSGRRGRSWPSVWFRSERVSALPPSDRLRGMGSSGNALRGGGLGPSRALGHSSPRVGRGLLRGPYSSSEIETWPLLLQVPRHATQGSIGQMCSSAHF
jgi:hypothetical protein